MSDTWAIFRITTEFIDENNAMWKKERIDKEIEEKKLLEEWDKLTRQEKINEINKEITRTQITPNTTNNTKQTERKKVEVWRKKETENKQNENNKNNRTQNKRLEEPPDPLKVREGSKTPKNQKLKPPTELDKPGKKKQDTTKEKKTRKNVECDKEKLEKRKGYWLNLAKKSKVEKFQNLSKCTPPPVAKVEEQFSSPRKFSSSAPADKPVLPALSPLVQTDARISDITGISESKYSAGLIGTCKEKSE